MQLFYAPDIDGPLYTLPQEESRHAVKVLRLRENSGVNLVDGRGTLFEGVVVSADPKGCVISIVSAIPQFGKRNYRLTMAVAPTKNTDRYEWFLEKATEIGCDVFVPLECEHSERKNFRPDRAERIVASAMKQSLKAYMPEIRPLTSFEDFFSSLDGEAVFIAHCAQGEKRYLTGTLEKGRDVVVLIGPEGDFSLKEINFAISKGAVPVSLGESRLRTETAAVTAVTEVSIINR